MLAALVLVGAMVRVLEAGRAARGGRRGCCTASVTSPSAGAGDAASPPAVDVAVRLAGRGAGRRPARRRRGGRRRARDDGGRRRSCTSPARLLDLHLNELFSAQSDEHHKSFLRMHIRDDGALVVHPLEVPRVSTSWDVAGRRPTEGDPWVKPRRRRSPVHLIEAPRRHPPGGAAHDRHRHRHRPDDPRGPPHRGGAADRARRPAAHPRARPGPARADPRPGPGRARCRRARRAVPAAAAAHLRRRAARRGLGRVAAQLARVHRPRPGAVDARRGRRVRPPRRGPPRARGDRRRHPQGRRALPGLDVVHDVGDGRAAARGRHGGDQRRLAAPGRPAVLDLQDRADLAARQQGAAARLPRLGRQAGGRPVPRARAVRPGHPPRVRQHGVPDGELHLRHRLAGPVVAREPRRRDPRLGARRVRRGAVHLLRPDGPQHPGRAPGADAAVRRAARVVRRRRHRPPTRGSSSSPARTTSASCRRASSSPTSSSPGTGPGATPCTGSADMATWTYFSAATPLRTRTPSSSRSWRDDHRPVRRPAAAGARAAVRRPVRGPATAAPARRPPRPGRRHPVHACR